MFTQDELNTLQSHLSVNSNFDMYDALRKILTSNSWLENENLVNSIQPALMRLCASYLYSEKRRGYALDGVG